MGEKAAEIISTVWWLSKTVQKTVFNKFSGCVPLKQLLAVSTPTKFRSLKQNSTGTTLSMR